MDRLWLRQFAVVAVLAPALSFVTPRQHPGAMWLGWGLCVLSVAWAAHSQRRPASWAAAIAPTSYILAIALLRHSQGGAVSGFSPLVLLPLFFVALVGDRRALWLLCAAITAGFVLPILLVGGTWYPTSEWRRAAIWLAVAPVAGLATQAMVEQARSANRRLETLVRTDPLTSLLNRRGFLEIADRELLRARRTREPLVLAMLDLDHFKAFNDRHGHAGGDRLLVAAAADWGNELREIDVLGRWGGEEFIVLLPRCPLPVAHNVLDRLRGATPEQQTGSVGLALWRPGETMDDLVARADAALYEAKAAGRDQTVAAV